MDTYHISGEFHEFISTKAIKNTTQEFQDMMKSYAMAIALYCPVFDGSMLKMLYEKVYAPTIGTKALGLSWKDKEALFPNPKKVAYTYSGQVNVPLTLEVQRNYFTSASKAFLYPLGFPKGKAAPLRKKSHDKVMHFDSKIYQKNAKIPQVLKEAIDKMTR